jgi:isoprenylcysteine carboxyl methyltransferase (ICMT) family protein YpbQ
MKLGRAPAIKPIIIKNVDLFELKKPPFRWLKKENYALNTFSVGCLYTFRESTMSFDQSSNKV